MSITVHIMSYKYGHLVAHALESVMHQSRPPEVVNVYDDGVGDCQHLKELYPGINLIERKENMGTVANFQDALENTDTDYVMFLGADNWLRPDTLEVLLDGSDGEDIITYDIIVLGANQDEMLEYHYDELEEYQGSWYWDRSSGHHGSMLYKTELAKEVGGYEREKRTKRTEEDAVLYRKMMNAGAKRIHIGTGLLYYNRHIHNFNQ